MKYKVNGIEFTAINRDFRKIFDGYYGGNQHLSTKPLAAFGCGSITLNNHAAYTEGKSYVREELISDQNDMFRKYLLGPTSALRFKLAAIWYYRKRGKRAKVNITHSYVGNLYGLRGMMLEIKKNIDADNPVPLIVGLRLKKGYRDGLYNHWVTVTGYADHFNVLVANNGKMETINLKELSERRMFLATAAITVLQS
ncbi:MAG TPA: hypothetical protein VK861_11495 [Bacteroidales bacterium]|nr:hypothetical protein [Bacteroidales bacterium]